MVVNFRKSLRVACMLPPGIETNRLRWHSLIMRNHGEVKYSTRDRARRVQISLRIPHSAQALFSTEISWGWSGMAHEALATGGKRYDSKRFILQSPSEVCACIGKSRT